MSSRLWALVGFVSLSTWGCGPPEVVQVVPPGVELPALSTEDLSEEERAEALGEQRLEAGEGAINMPGGTVNTEPIPLAEPTEPGQSQTMASGLTYETITPGTGEVAKTSKQVSVHYTGTMEDGTKFDSSRDRNEPLVFTLGTRAVIPGWEQGIAGMKVGERRKLIIPPDLAYGSKGKGPVPPDATLIFDVELLDVR